MYELFSQPYYDFTYPILSDGIVTAFIHKSCEPKAFIKSMLYFTENLIGVDFRLVKKGKNAELKFYETPLTDLCWTCCSLCFPCW
jgi:hypothetical protein